jgi:hypothetical protein
MPRKNARPAAKKERAKKKAKMQKKPVQHTGYIAHHASPPLATMALLVGALGHIPSTPPRDDVE